jgi:hypothetical protein
MMTRLSVLLCLFWFAFCFFFLEGSANQWLDHSAFSARPHMKEMDQARISFLLYSCVPVAVWLMEVMRAEAVLRK